MRVNFFRFIILFIAYLVSWDVLAEVSWHKTKQIYYNIIVNNKLRRFPIYLIKNDGLSGYTTTNGIYIPTGSLKGLSPAEMALSLGHELAHNEWFDVYYKLPGKYQEDRADYYGSKWARRAGYSKCKQATLFIKFYNRYGNNGGRNDPHSSNLKRFIRLYKGCEK